MILQALNRYYDILLADPARDMAPPGYCWTGVSYTLNLSAQGELLDIFPQFDQVSLGKKTVDKPRRMLVPEQFKRSGSAPKANFLCDNAAFVLGISEKDIENPGYSAKRFDSFRQLHEDLLTGVDCDIARAILAFLQRHNPSEAAQQPEIARNLEALLTGGGNLAFQHNGVFAHQDARIKQAWETYTAGKDAVSGQCLVTGEMLPIARLHSSLKGIRDANATGASLVCFKEPAYESFKKTGLQGLNSPVSEKAAFSYTTVLNYLLSSANPNRKITIGDTTVVYWAESEKRDFADLFESLFEPPLEEEQPAPEPDSRNRAETELKNVAEKVRRVQRLDLPAMLRSLEGESPRFYVLGLAPNAARISVRFFLNDPFQKMVERMMTHYADMAIEKEYDNQPDYITVRAVLEETVSKKSRDKDASPLMAGALMRAILTGAPYPAALYYAIITRIRADADDKEKRIKKINYVRVAVIKAFLTRKYRNQNKYQEVLTMSLNEQSDTPAYVLGRLFAVLEKAQQEAIGDVNASIKDRYFTSACASPASVFPVLLRLSQHHISKAEYGGRLDRRIQDILALLDVQKNPIPSRLTLDEQGIFVLGYYHQRAAFYAKNTAAAVPNPSQIN